MLQQSLRDLAAWVEQGSEPPASTTVEFTGSVSVPPGTGAVVAADWDFDGAGEFPVKADLPDVKTEVTVTTRQPRWLQVGKIAQCMPMTS
jgi:hypothetical protein